MPRTVDYTAGPWAPVAMTVGNRTFWVVVNRAGQRLAETEVNAKIIAEAVNRALEADRCSFTDDGPAALAASSAA